MTIEEFDQTKFVPKFSKNEEVEVISVRDKRYRYLAGRKGVIRSIGIPLDALDAQYITYMVEVYDEQELFSFAEFELVSTGNMREPTRFVGSIRVSQDGEMLSDGIMPPDDHEPNAG